MDLLDTQVYGMIGEQGFARLVGAFYRRVREDEILKPMYPPEDLAGAEQRLREFLIQRFGGPQMRASAAAHAALAVRDRSAGAGSMDRVDGGGAGGDGAE